MALTLRLIGGLTTDEIARAFLVPEPTHRAAHRARQADAGRRQVPLRGAARRGAGGAARLGAGGDLPDLQRGLRGDRRRRLDAAAALRGGAAARPHPRRAGAGRAGGARPGGADGDPGLAAGGARRARTASRSCCWTRTARAGTMLPSAAAWRRWRGPRRCRPPGSLHGCRRRSPPATPARPPPRTPTGRGSPRSTARLPRSSRRRWSSSTARSRWRWRTGRRPGLAILDALAGEPALKAYHLLPAARGDLLEKLGRKAEARAEFERAAAMTRNERERAVMLSPRGGLRRMTVGEAADGRRAPRSAHAKPPSGASSASA